MEQDDASKQLDVVGKIVLVSVVVESVVVSVMGCAVEADVGVDESIVVVLEDATAAVTVASTFWPEPVLQTSVSHRLYVLPPQAIDPLV